jgi:hypothetical protein
MCNYVEAAMKNITLAIDEGVLSEARAYATARGTTVNALVREHLAQLGAEDKRIEAARRGLRELMENSTGRLGPDYKWNREELYADRVFPRQQRSDLRRRRKK